MVQRLFDFFFPCLPCFPGGGWLEQENAVNECINIRSCICTSLFLLLKIKYFGLKAFIFLSVLCLQKKIIFWIALYCAFKCSFPAENGR